MSAPALPKLINPKTFGNVKTGSFWTEYPSGLLDLTRKHPPSEAQKTSLAPQKAENELEFDVEGNRRIRIDPKQSAIIIVDMQKYATICNPLIPNLFDPSLTYFLHPEILEHPTGLECVQPITNLVTFFRKAGVRIIWLNWGLTRTELENLPPVFLRSFNLLFKGGGFGCDIGGEWGPTLMRGTPNADLYGPLKEEYLKGKEAGTDIWIHKNRVGGLWGPGTPLGLYLQEEGINTLFFAGVNTDQCVLGTLMDAYFHGFDNIVIKDATATTSPNHCVDSVLFNAEMIYGFVTTSQKILGNN